jgi:hypothetical protein
MADIARVQVTQPRGHISKAPQQHGLHTAEKPKSTHIATLHMSLQSTATAAVPWEDVNSRALSAPAKLSSTGYPQDIDVLNKSARQTLGFLIALLHCGK